MERGNRRERERGRTGRGPRVAMIRATKRYKRDDVARGSVADRRRQKWSGERRRSKVEKGRCDRDCEEGQSADCTLGSGERGRGTGDGERCNNDRKLRASRFRGTAPTLNSIQLRYSSIIRLIKKYRRVAQSLSVVCAPSFPLSPSPSPVD